MRFSRPLKLNGQPINASSEPLTCTPVVGRSEHEVLAQLDSVVSKSPDLLEWRIDFFEGLADQARIASLAKEVRNTSRGIPLILTRRSIREGGEPIEASEAEVLASYGAICEAGCADFIDCELSSDPADFAEAKAIAEATGTQLIASFHDFEKTPAVAEIVGKLVAMQAAGADVAKVAVMPRTPGDVLTLLQATLAAQQQVSVPIITMSMGGLGAISRLFGWMFGSSVTFAVGEQASAPGQIPVEELRETVALIQRAMDS